ncbi:MAG: O-antigen ligase family protein [Erysipelotrichales bacterium]|nr:O-antigen ligase family protein [Erysipelotrichales bacterium]
MRKLRIDYKYIEYITVALLTMVFLTIPIIHYICLRNGWPNDYLAYSIYGLAIIDVIFIAVMLLLYSNIEFKWGTYEWIFTVLIILEILSVINSVNKYISIWGTPGRNEGILMLLSYYTFFYLARFLKSDKSKYLLVNIFLGIGVVHCLYGVCQYFDFFPNIVIENESYDYHKMVSGLTGNYDFMATYTIMLSLLTLGLFYYSSSIKKKVLYAICILLYLFTAILTKTMAVYLGVGVGVIVFFLYMFITKKRHIQFANSYNISFPIVIVGVVAVSLLFFIINNDNNNSLLLEIKDAFRQLFIVIKNGTIDDDFANGRGYIWVRIIKLLKEYWLFGVGVDALLPVMSYYFDTYQNIGIMIDKAHNEFLQILITMGLPTLIVYLSFYFFVIKDALQRLVEIINKDSSWVGEPLYAGIFFVIFGYLAQSFFNISVIDVAPFFWILIGLATCCPLNVQSLQKNSSIKKRKIVKYMQLPNGQRIAIVEPNKRNV